MGNLSRLRALSQSLELAVAGKFLSLMKALDCQTVHVYSDGIILHANIDTRMDTRDMYN